MTKKQIKNLLKNGYIFQLNVWNTKKDFADSLIKLFDKWPSPYRKKELGYAWEYRRHEDVNEKRSVAFTQRIKFINSLKKRGKALEFYKDINDFLKKYDLSYEWFTTIIDFVVSVWSFPPFRNLDIQESGKRVVLILNPDTSLEDIEEAWPEIKEKQKGLWPKFKKINLTKKSFINLKRAIQDLEERFLKGMEEFDKVEWKKYKTTDLDIATKIWENEEDISQETDVKRKNYLRQIRKRFKEKQKRI